MNRANGYSVAIPAYNRPIEFEELLVSISLLEKLPDEVIICEDNSKQRKELSIIAQNWNVYFTERGVEFRFIENEFNLGYDANVRKLVEQASFKWVILMGNDDLLLPKGLDIIDDFCTRNPNLAMVSRPFLRFENDISKPIGVSRILNGEQIIKKGSYSPKFIFRACGFVGGLIVNKNWAAPFHTTKYDGSLYYQIYLGCNAYCTNSIGYLGEAPVGGRAGNPPMFGEAGAENHVPGAYSAKGRASMWKGVLDMARQVGEKYKIDLLTDIRQELMVRQSFHIFEMNAGVDGETLNDLKARLSELGLFNHIVPKSFFYINYIFGRKSRIIYRLIRKYTQKA